MFLEQNVVSITQHVYVSRKQRSLFSEHKVLFYKHTLLENTFFVFQEKKQVLEKHVSRTHVLFQKKPPFQIQGFSIQVYLKSARLPSSGQFTSEVFLDNKKMRFFVQKKACCLEQNLLFQRTQVFIELQKETRCVYNTKRLCFQKAAQVLF